MSSMGCIRAGSKYNALVYKPNTRFRMILADGARNIRKKYSDYLPEIDEAYIQKALQQDPSSPSCFKSFVIERLEL